MSEAKHRTSELREANETPRRGFGSRGCTVGTTIHTYSSQSNKCQRTDIIAHRAIQSHVCAQVLNLDILGRWRYSTSQY